MASPFESFVAGRQARQQYDYGQTRNKLADMELADAPAQMQRRNALADIEMQRAQLGLQGDQYQIDAAKAKDGYARLQQALGSGSPREYVLRHEPELAAKLSEQGFDLAAGDDAYAKSVLEGYAREYAGKAGIAPPQPKTPEPFTLGAGQTRYGPDGKPIASAPVSNQMTPYQEQRLAIERQKLNQPKSGSGPLVQVAGPDGNPVYATREDAVGKPAYVARDKPAAADLKYQREIKAKMPRLNAALRRMDRVEKAVEKIAKNRAFDGGEVDQYVINRTEDGRELIAAAAQLLPELTALTRVPGIGSQSDLETRLANLQFPSSEFPPEVNRRNAAELRAFLSDLKDAYSGAEQEIQSSEVQSLLDKYAPQ